MKKDNHYLADKLYEHADWLEAMAESPYKTRAYRRAARFIQSQEKNLYDLVKKGFDLTELPTIGQGISYVINTFIKTNQFPEKAISKRKLPSKFSGFLRLYHGLKIVQVLSALLERIPEIQEVNFCGDFRRKRELIDELIVLIQCTYFKAVLAQLTKFTYVLSQDKNHFKLRLISGIDLSVYCVDKKTLSAALLYHTGNHQHFNKLVHYASKKGFKLNEKGLFKGEKCIPLEEEAQIYKHLGFPFIEPELRENRGEIEACESNNLPRLIELKDIKGDLHSHTKETDGQDTLENMAKAASEKGYEYLAITDHSKSLYITHGLDEKRLLKQIKQIDKLNEHSNQILILKSIEVDILEDGSLDLSDDVLKELDIVVCSVHSKFKLDETKQTERILRAMDNPYFHIWGHPTGRLLKSRPPYPLNLERIFKAAKERNCIIELNAQPYRLDINDHYCKKAKEMGLKIAISSDAHTTRGLNFMQLGIYQARRGWLERADVINTRSWLKLKQLLRKP